MNVLLAAAGTRGDVVPLVALGEALRSRGHSVTLAAPPCFEAAASQLEFVAMGRDVEAWLRDEGSALSASPWSLFRLLNRALRSELEAQFRLLPALSRDTDLIIGAGALVAGSSVARARGVPYRYAAFTPQTIPSVHHMPTVLPFQGAPRWANALAWRLCNRFYDWLLLPELNRHRLQLNLTRASTVLEHFLPAGQVVLAVDPELSCSLDLGGVAMTGAWQSKESEALPDEVRTFLGRGARPIFAGFGSMPDPTPKQTAAVIIEAARRLGRPVILASTAEMNEPDVLVLRRPVSHARLFMGVDLVIHHGGAGTTSTAARSAAPQVIVPHGGDQFGFARQAHRLGIAPAPFARNRLTVDRLENAIRSALTAQTRQAASALSDVLRRREGCDRMVEHIESLNAPGCSDLSASRGWSCASAETRA